MYERNAIVLERYFAKLFGYDEKNNLKSNYSNFVELVEKIEKYQEAVKNEDEIIAEYDQIIKKIKEVQNKQEALSNKNTKLQENRNNIFENIDENVDNLKKRLDKIEEETKRNNEEMKENGETFIQELNLFNDKTTDRNQCSRSRRIVEGEYQKTLKETIANLNGISPEKVEEVKNFFKAENNIQEEIQEKVMKNGSKEKIPFDLTAIGKAIDLETDIEEKETEILCTVYDKTKKLLTEIKNDTIKTEKHKKLIKDSQSKLNFLNAMKDYLTLFLDNERLNIVGGQKEHKKLMSEACKNLEQDLEQIRNLYTLLTKEIAGKVTKKMYKDLYHSEYLYDLEEQEKEFENNISRLNVIGTVIYPDYWRLEGMQKIFASFKNSVVDFYGRDLSEYEPILKYNDKIEKIEDKEIEDMYNDIDFDDDEDEEENEEIEEQQEHTEEETEDEEITEEKDKEIDQILGFYNFEDDLVNDDSDEKIDDEENEEEEDIEDIDDFDDEDFEDYEYGFDDEDDGYDNIDFDDEDEDDEDLSSKKKRK